MRLSAAAVRECLASSSSRMMGRAHHSFTAFGWSGPMFSQIVQTELLAGLVEAENNQL
jgi:hypothetical protein